MKKSFLILVILLAIVILPMSVEAGTLKSYINTPPYQCKTEQSNGGLKKVTTCDVVFKNEGTSIFNGGPLTLTLTPNNPSTSAVFVFNDTEAKLVGTTGNVYTLNVEPINPGEEAKLGTVTWSADNTVPDADCGGKIIPDWNGADVWEDDAPETGYAIPYVALAIGGVGIITVIACSKKNRKMFKI